MIFEVKKEKLEVDGMIRPLEADGSCHEAKRKT
jgi:hypothetical protein